MATPKEFVFLKGFATMHAEFQRPAFNLFTPSDPSRVPRELLQTLGDTAGLKLGDLKWEQGDGSLTSWHLRAILFNFSVTLRINLERIELETYALERIPVESLAQAADSVLDTILHLNEKSPFASVWVDVGLHGTLSPDPDELLGRFVRDVPKFRGELTGRGCSFVFGPDDEQISSVLTVESSGVVPGGVFLRKRTGWTGAKLGAVSLSQKALSEFEELMSTLGVTVRRG